MWAFPSYGWFDNNYYRLSSLLAALMSMVSRSFTANQTVPYNFIVMIVVTSAWPYLDNTLFPRYVPMYERVARSEATSVGIFAAKCFFAVYSLSEFEDAVVRHRSFGMFAVIWRCLLPKYCSSMHYCYIAGVFILVIELIFSRRAFTLHEGVEMPLRFAFVLPVLNILLWHHSKDVMKEWHDYKEVQQELADEKDTQEALISMLCDSCIHLDVDGDIISRSSPLFDGLIKQKAQGSRLSTYLPEGDVDAARLEDAITRARNGPVALPLTLVSTGDAQHRVDVFIVRRGDSSAHVIRGFMVGLRTDECSSDTDKSGSRFAGKDSDIVRQDSGELSQKIESSAGTSECGQKTVIAGASEYDRQSRVAEHQDPGFLIRSTFLCAEGHSGIQRVRSSSAPPVMSSTSRPRVGSSVRGGSSVHGDDITSLRSDSSGKYTDWSMRHTSWYEAQARVAASSSTAAAVAIETERREQDVQSGSGHSKASGLSAEIRAYGIPDSVEQLPRQRRWGNAMEDIRAQDSTADEVSSQCSDSSCSDWSAPGRDSDLIKLGFGASNTCLPLSEILRLKACNVASYGSLHGPYGRCEPCSFHFTHIHTPLKRPPCRASYLCEYCHDISHCPKWRSKLRKCRPPPDLRRRQG